MITHRHRAGEREQLVQLGRLVRTALERDPADLVLRGCRVVSVHSEEAYSADIVIADGRIAGVRERFHGATALELRCDGLVALPGLIEPYLAPVPAQLLEDVASALAAHGTTTVFMASTGAGSPPQAQPPRLSGLPCRVFHLDAGGAPILSKRPDRRLGETYQLDTRLNPDHPPWMSEEWSGGAAVITSSRALGLDGLNALAASGVRADRGATSFEELHARLRTGLAVVLPVQPDSPRFAEILRALAEHALDTRHICFSATPARPGDLLQNRTASLARAITVAIQQGISPFRAVQMASLNTAAYYGLDHEIGSIAPGRWADIILVPDLSDCSPELVILGGRVVAGGSITAKAGDHRPEASGEGG